MWKKKKTDVIEFPNEDSIRTFGENENYKHLEILGADNFKEAEMKEEKGTSEEQENCSIMIFTEEMSPKE